MVPAMKSISRCETRELSQPSTVQYSPPPHPAPPEKNRPAFRFLTKNRHGFWLFTKKRVWFPVFSGGRLAERISQPFAGGRAKTREASGDPNGKPSFSASQLRVDGDFLKREGKDDLLFFPPLSCFVLLSGGHVVCFFFPPFFSSGEEHGDAHLTSGNVDPVLIIPPPISAVRVDPPNTKQFISQKIPPK